MEMFASNDHQKIFAVIYELASDGRAVRVPIVAGRLGSLSNDQDPDAYLSMLLHVASREEELPLSDYAYELRKTASRRKIKALAEGILKSANDINLDPDQIIDRASERLADMSRNAAIEHEASVSSTIRQIYTSATQHGSGMALRPCLKGLEQMVGPSRRDRWFCGAETPARARQQQRCSKCCSLPSPTQRLSSSWRWTTWRWSRARWPGRPASPCATSCAASTRSRWNLSCRRRSFSKTAS